MKNRQTLMVAIAVVGLLVVVPLIAGVGAFLGNRMAQSPAAVNGSQSPMELMAATAARTDSMSMAAGLIDNDVEGLFVLDHVSGNLQCWILNPRNGQVAGIYRANVLEDLGVGAGKAGAAGNFVMCTGNFFFSGARGNDAPGQTVCYVGDGETGNVVGYGLVINRPALNRGQAQGGTLNVVCKGATRDGGATRDQ